MWLLWEAEVERIEEGARDWRVGWEDIVDVAVV